MLVLSEVNTMKDMKKVRLVKSRTNKLLTGVCGGIGELIGIDPTIIRLIWAHCHWPAALALFCTSLQR